MQDKYLGIMVDETDRLNKLTSGLLELNRFDTKARFLISYPLILTKSSKKLLKALRGCRVKKLLLTLYSHPLAPMLMQI